MALPRFVPPVALCTLALAAHASSPAQGVEPIASGSAQVASTRTSSSWEQKVADSLLAARGNPSAPANHCADRLAELGPAAAGVLLDAVISNRVAVDLQRPQDDVLLQAREPQQLRLALTRFGRDGLLPYALVGTLDDASRGDRQRALLVLELVGRAEDLEVAASVAAATTPDDVFALHLQRGLERATAAIAARDAAALRHLHDLLEDAPDAVSTSLVRGVAACGRSDALDVLADGLDEFPQLELLLLGEIARAAARAPRPCDAHVQAEVRERFASLDPMTLRVAMSAAGALEDFDALPALVERLSAPTRGVRQAAHEALKRISGLAYAAEPRTWSTWLAREQDWYARCRADLSTDIDSPAPGRVLTALRELAGHRYRRHDLATLASGALDHPDPVVRRAACSTLAALGSDVCTEQLLKRLDDENAGVAQAARASLETLRGDARAQAN